jgi:hypothetical protein
MMIRRFTGLIEDFPLLRTRHLRGEDADTLQAAGFEGYYIGGPPRVELQRDGRLYAEIRLELVPFNDAVRPLLLCPRCGARRGVLVLHPSGIGCRGRECLNLTWRTTRQSAQERRELRREYLDGLLLDDDGELRRPYGMRVKVFDALVNEWFRLELIESGSTVFDCDVRWRA